MISLILFCKMFTPTSLPILLSNLEARSSQLLATAGAPQFIFFTKMIGTDTLSRQLYIHHDSPTTNTIVKVSEKKSDHRTGTFLWGGNREQAVGGLHRMLFALSETVNYSEACRHVAIDSNRGVVSYKFSCEESGDTMALNGRCK